MSYSVINFDGYLIQRSDLIYANRVKLDPRIIRRDTKRNSITLNLLCHESNVGHHTKLGHRIMLSHRTTLVTRNFYKNARSKDKITSIIPLFNCYCSNF